MNKYHPFLPLSLSNRQWPNHVIDRPPIWCSVDLRDGNQSLIDPMDVERKKAFFRLLIDMGYKEIEVGFPSASRTDYDFLRFLIEENWIPQDVTIQVLTQARDDLIEQTFNAIKGIPRAIVHVYNSTSELQRRVVFQLDCPQIIDIACRGVSCIRSHAEKLVNTEIILEYSPESFTGTELDFALEICESVMEIWQPTPQHKMILNLPATVEMSTPNIYADQIEYFSQNIRNRESFILSIHPHNDRGTAIAATELALMAGAQRVEGTLFGNGERTGNVDLITLALNLYTQGIDPGISINDINKIVDIYEYCNQLPVHQRHPYAGELVFTAFSGSHQDAIKKGFNAQHISNSDRWEIPYLPIDPHDIGRTYEAVIRINSQSGKGGISYIMKRDYGIELPRHLQIEFSQVVQKVADTSSKEIESPELWQIFTKEYLECQGPFTFIELEYCTLQGDDNQTEIHTFIQVWEQEQQVQGRGNGPIDAFFKALSQLGISEVQFVGYREQAISTGADAQAIAFIELSGNTNQTTFGIGIDSSIIIASLKGIISGLNRLYCAGTLSIR